MLSVEGAEENEGADDIEDASEGRLPNVVEASKGESAVDLRNTM
jgi:hypothetical protein